MKNGFERGFNLGDMPVVRRGLLCPDCVIDFDVPEGTVVGDIMNYKSKTDRIMKKVEIQVYFEVNTATWTYGISVDGGVECVAMIEDAPKTSNKAMELGLNKVLELIKGEL